jgi:hypothetical protein
MVLFQAIIEVFAGSMEHLIPQSFTHCSWIGGMPVRCHSFWSVANNGKSVLKEPLGCVHITFLTQS